MDRTPTYSQFRLFLQDAKCESSFDRAFYESNDYTCLDEQLWLAIDDYQSLFLRCFRWQETSEGDEYWRRIDSLWQLRFGSIRTKR